MSSQTQTTIIQVPKYDSIDTSNLYTTAPTTTTIFTDEDNLESSYVASSIKQDILPIEYKDKDSKDQEPKGTD